jgi:orotate phosphoribosyltransferase
MNKIIDDAFSLTGSVMQGHFLLSSGRHSDTYIQCAKLFIAPQQSAIVCSLLREKLTAAGLTAGIEYIVSPAIGGIIMGYEMARNMEVKNLFAERIADTMTLRRGFSLPHGAKVIVVEDVVTTGGSVREVMRLVRSLGGIVQAVASIVDRSNGLVSFDVPFVALQKMDVKSYEPHACPLCKSTNMPLEKPGSRIISN